MMVLKRLVAFWVDYSIILILLIFLMPLVGVRPMRANPILFWSETVIGIYLYFCFNDVLFKGLSIGKKTVQIQVKLKTKNIYIFAITHSLLKEICVFLWPICLIFYLVNRCKMPYNNLFYKEIT